MEQHAAGAGDDPGGGDVDGVGVLRHWLGEPVDLDDEPLDGQLFATVHR
jgi:hypothetical protein